jgi:hypothetical protein
MGHRCAPPKEPVAAKLATLGPFISDLCLEVYRERYEGDPEHQVRLRMSEGMSEAEARAYQRRAAGDYAPVVRATLRALIRGGYLEV